MNTILLASARFAGEDGARNFLESSDGLGGFITAVMGIGGLIALIVCGLKAFKEFTSGKTGPGVRMLVLGAILAAVGFNPKMLIDIAGVGGNVWDIIVTTASDITG